MPNGIYSAAAGMAAQQSRLDAIANDLANASTTGYKSERIGFRDLLGQAGTAIVDLGRSQAQGVLQPSVVVGRQLGDDVGRVAFADVPPIDPDVGARLHGRTAHAFQ